MEVCVDNLESAVNAEKGGAIRLELCSALNEGGLTPSVGFLRIVKKKVKIPVFVMVRPRGGDFTYSDEEVEVMSEDIDVLKENGADGFVFGIITGGGNVDVKNCLKLLKLTETYPVTFHRAFDEVEKPLKSMEEIISMGFKRILTSGLQKTAFEGISQLKKLIEAAKDRIIIMPGAGIKSDNLQYILKETQPVEFHGSAKIQKNDYFVTDMNSVRDMVAIYGTMQKDTNESGSANSKSLSDLK